MTFGAKIKQLREAKKLTQEDLAARLQKKKGGEDITRERIANWETGRHFPNPEHMVILSDFLKVSLDVLLRPNKRLEPVK